MVIDIFIGMKEVMVVKIAYQCSDMYADAMKLMQLPSLKDMWPRVRHLFQTYSPFLLLNQYWKDSSQSGDLVTCFPVTF